MLAFQLVWNTAKPWSDSTVGITSSLLSVVLGCVDSCHRQRLTCSFFFSCGTLLLVSWNSLMGSVPQSDIWLRHLREGACSWGISLLYLRSSCVSLGHQVTYYSSSASAGEVALPEGEEDPSQSGQPADDGEGADVEKETATTSQDPMLKWVNPGYFRKHFPFKSTNISAKLW